MSHHRPTSSKGAAQTQASAPGSVIAGDATGWAVVEPQAVGFAPARLATAVQYACATEIDWPVDVGLMVARDDPPPYNRRLGPTRPRGPASGLVIRAGRQAATWGEPQRVDVTFSATKSYLSTCVGMAVDRGLIDSVNDPVADYVAGDLFAGQHNGAVTWHHLLQQTSEWSGTLFGVPDSVDHYRSLQSEDEPAGHAKGSDRPLHAPGSYWEYNDVRVNALALAALHVWREPLEDVLRRELMQPIGAESEWQWHPYDNAYVELDGRRLPSVPGGAHWGGGLWISAADHARFGQLWLQGGQWRGRQVLSTAWIEAALRACEHNERYGYMWWLNTGDAAWHNAGADAFAAQGAGGNVVCVVPAHDLIVVTRWAGDPAGVIERVIDAID